MTETEESNSTLPRPVQDFVLQWGYLGDRWGVNRSVSQIHALLYASERPLSSEEIAEALGIARSNVSNSLRELLAWESFARSSFAETAVPTTKQRPISGHWCRVSPPAARRASSTPRPPRCVSACRLHRATPQ